MIPIRISDIEGKKSKKEEELFYTSEKLSTRKKKAGLYETGIIISLEHRNLDKHFFLWAKIKPDEHPDLSVKTQIDGINVSSDKLNHLAKDVEDWIYLGQQKFSSRVTSTHYIEISSANPIKSLYLANDSSLLPPPNITKFEKRLYGFTRKSLGMSSLEPSSIEASGKEIFTLEYTVGEQGVGENGSLIIGIPWGIFPIPLLEGVEERKDFQKILGNHVRESEERCPLSGTSTTADLELEFLPFQSFGFKTREYLIRIIPTDSLSQGSKIKLQFGEKGNEAKVYQSFPYTYTRTEKIHWYTPTVLMRVLVDPIGNEVFAPLSKENSHQLKITPRKGKIRTFFFGSGSFTKKVNPKGIIITDVARNPKKRISGKDISVSSGRSKGFSKNGYRASLPYFVSKTSSEEGLANPSISGKSILPYTIYWGDIHGHCGMDDGLGDLTQYFVHGRDYACLDFCALTCHSEYLTAQQWQRIVSVTNKFNEPGEFVTLNSFEWTPLEGHKNVYTPSNKMPLLRSTSGPEEENKKNLSRILDKLDEPLDATVIPHHTLDGHDWSSHDPKKEKLVEIYSMWGSSEYRDNPLWDKPQPGPSIREILDQGAKVGFTAGADTHEAKPGFSTDTRGTNGRYGNLRYKNGVFAVLAEKLDRKSLFEALKKRRTFATTGERMILLLKANDKWMGSEIGGEELNLDIFVAGRKPIEEVRIVKDGEVVKSLSPRKMFFKEEWVANFGDWRYLYVKAVQEDGEIAWTSPVFHERLK